MTEFGDWDSFYVIAGSSAGALIGLQFVVMTLIAERPPREALFGVGAAAPLLLFIGIHNAWDNVAYHVLVRLGGGNMCGGAPPRHGNDP